MLKNKLDKLHGYYYVFVAIFVVVVFFWSLVFSGFDKVRANQRLTVSVYNAQCDRATLKELIVEILPSITDQEILEVYVDLQELNVESDSFQKILTYQNLQTDIAILPMRFIDSIDVTKYYPEISSEVIEEYFAGVPTYSIDGKVYGLLIDGGDVSTRFAQYNIESEPYYLFFSASSSNLDRIYDTGDSGDDAGLVVAKFLMERVP